MMPPCIMKDKCCIVKMKRERPAQPWCESSNQSQCIEVRECACALALSCNQMLNENERKLDGGKYEEEEEKKNEHIAHAHEAM